MRNGNKDFSDFDAPDSPEQRGLGEFHNADQHRARAGAEDGTAKQPPKSEDYQEEQDTAASLAEDEENEAYDRMMQEAAENESADAIDEDPRSAPAELQTDLPPHLKHIFFPYDHVRKIQDQLIDSIYTQLKESHNLIAHAPTGLGKTAAALGPAVTIAVENDLSVFFLTSRHMQHKIVLETLKKIHRRHNTKFPVVSVIGKKWLCLQGGIERLGSREFLEYCRAMREDGKCEFYENLRHTGGGDKEELSADTKVALSKLSREIRTTEDVIETSKKHSLCPYEISLLLAKKARVIVCDYQYMFNPDIRSNFLNKLGKELEKSIIIVDEAHNLPSRVKDLSSSYLSNIMLRKAISEANKFEFEEIEHHLKEIMEILEGYAMAFEQRTISDMDAKGNGYNVPEMNIAMKERYIEKDDFLARVNRIKDINAFAQYLNKMAMVVREEQKMSYLGSIAEFLIAWQKGDEGFTRIFSVKEGIREKMLVLSYRCLDPSLAAAPVLNQCAGSVMMSGTLTPTAMYKELLGVENCVEKVFPSPFPKENKLSLVIPKTSTQYKSRSNEQFIEMAQVLGRIIADVPGNMAVFFPSYYLRDRVYDNFIRICNKTIFKERPEMTKLEKHDFLEQFKRYKKTGAVLFGVISGSFAEGIDLPGDELVGVIVVGLPLSRPDLETKALIKYYDGKFGKGWEYGYVGPAFNKTLQSAGRCIRTEKDRGIVVYLDERYAWPQYYKYFPPGEVKISIFFEKLVKAFFEIIDI